MTGQPFDRVAVEYAAIHARNVGWSGDDPGHFADQKIAWMARALGPQATSPLAILDLGIGIGQTVEAVRKHLPGCHLTGLDPSLESLKIARGRVADKVALICADGTALPFTDEAFDLVYLACVLHHVRAEQQNAVLTEALRVIRRGGYLFVFEHNPFNPLTQWVVCTCPFDRDARLIRAGRMMRLAAAAGFVDVRVDYTLFFPKALAPFRPAERYLSRVPMGAQYVVSARR